MKEILRNSDGH